MSQNKNKEVITVTHFETPLGKMIAGATGQGICLLEFTDSRRQEPELDIVARHLGAEVSEGDSVRFSPLKKELTEYFSGERKEFTVPLHLIGTDFQCEVWNELLRIPYGKTRSYKEQALALNKLDAIRAVAGANGMNKIVIIVPCHRVIGANGSLTGFGGGLWRKKWLLDLESGQLPLNTL